MKQNHKKYTTKEWIEIASNEYPNFDYSLVFYIDKRTKVKIICKKHGVFEVIPNCFLKNGICPKCKEDEIVKTKTYNFIKRAIEKYGHNKYTYDLVEFHNSRRKVVITCNKHGSFEVLPSNFLNYSVGCPVCAKEKQSKSKYTLSEWIEKFNLVHKNKYDYSLIQNIKHYDEKVDILCKKHGIFRITPHNHLKGQGCLHCYNEKRGNSLRMDNKKFIEKAKLIHGDKYDYSKVEYINTMKKVRIICPIHGEFYQRPNDHLSSKQGCPICNESKLEKEIRLFLCENNIKHECQKHFNWLGRQSLDFYLPDYNISIECQGAQHFINDKFYKNLNVIKERDLRKYNLCIANNIKMIYFLDKKYNTFMCDNLKYINKCSDLLKFIIL